MKSRKDLLQKLGIAELNQMQQQAIEAINSKPEVILLSPTGTGKTLAFLLPILETISTSLNEVQVMIVVPTRELAIQIENVIRDLGAGFKCNAVYGGQSFNQDKLNLKHTPSIIVGTPGRLADHLRRGTFSTDYITYLVLDEFDKSLEIGYEDEMKQIVTAIPEGSKRILTSATNAAELPDFVDMSNAGIVSNTDKGSADWKMQFVESPDKDKLNTLVKTLHALSGQNGIVFCNFKDSINRVSEFLFDEGVPHGCFYGGLEQHEREISLIKFRNGTHRLILATDLAARGLDIPDIDFIVHYHLPLKQHEFTHRNGRTARMNRDGTVYILKWTQEELPEYLPQLEEAILPSAKNVSWTWKTIKLSAGRRDKISKGDIAGLFYKKGGVAKDELGHIELQTNAAFVAVKAEIALELIQRLDGEKLKRAKLRVTGV